ncbi:MAG TPA: aspartate aminotransferase [Myxococcales bacterium]|nr:aspartate aminotransferase [Myxococcales bacterium]
MKLSTKARNLRPSPTLTISTRAKQLRADGHKVLDLSLGEPDFPTPTPIRAAAKDAIDKGYTKYTPSAGILPLRQRISSFLRERRGLTYGTDQIVVSTGAKQCLFNAILALVDPGDEVIIPSPYWVSYPSQVEIAGGDSVFVETKLEDNFQIDPDAIEHAITPYTKLIILNSPNNPTGAIYTKERVEAIAKLAAKKGIWLLSDEIYDELVYEGAKAHSPFQLCPEAQEKGILINGFSKAYAMTGWRLGYIAAPKPLIKAIRAIQGASTSGTNSIAQHAGVAALDMDRALLEEMRQTFEGRMLFLREKAKELPHVKSSSPQGAFYLMLDFSHYLGMQTPSGQTITSTVDLATYLLEQKYVAFVPGEAFGAPGKLRISYATDKDTLAACIDRTTEALKELR